MQRSHLLYALLFVALLFGFLFVLRDNPPQQFAAPQDRGVEQQVMQVYAVPPARGTAIRDALRTVLNSSSEQKAQGMASLPSPNQLVVAAPLAMQDSIGQAIAQLSAGAPVATAVEGPATLELWVVDVLSADAGMDVDPALASAAEAIASARQQLGLGGLRASSRVLGVIASDHGRLYLDTGSLTGQVQIESASAHSLRMNLEINLQATDPERGRPLRFNSLLDVPLGQWQVVGLLQSGREDTPARLLLLRATASSATDAQ